MPTVEEAERAVLAISAGEWTHQQTGDWLSRYLTAPLPPQTPRGATRRPAMTAGLRPLVGL